MYKALVTMEGVVEMAVETDQNDNILRKQVRLITRALDKRIESQGAQLDQIAQDMTELQNTGVDTTAREGLAEITSTLTVADAAWEVA